MRFSLLTVGAFAAGSIAAPALSVEKRQVADVFTVVQGLYTQVTSYTSIINSTLDSVSGVDVAGVELANITAIVKDQVASIVSIVDSVLDQTKNLTDLTDLSSITGLTGGLTSGLPVVGSITGLTKSIPVVGSLTGKRQVADVSDVTGTVVSLVSEITGTLNGVVAIVPLADIEDVIPPLTKAVSSLLGSVDDIVGGVISTVFSIVKDLGIVVKVADLKVGA